MSLPKSKILAQFAACVGRTQAARVIDDAPPRTSEGSSTYWEDPRTFSAARPNLPATLSTAGACRSAARTSVSAPIMCRTLSANTASPVLPYAWESMVRK